VNYCTPIQFQPTGILMKMKFVSLLVATMFSFFAILASAHAEITYLRDFPGWTAAVQPDGKIIIDRQDRPGATVLSKPSIILFPKEAQQFTAQEQVQAWIGEVKAMVADKYKACTPIRDMDLEPNGMGVFVQDREKAPHCVLWISGAKDGHMFVNLRLDDGMFEQEKQPSQQSALVFIRLTAARMQAKEFLKKNDEGVNLSRFADMVPAAHRPARMLAVQYDKEQWAGWTKDRYKAITLLNNYMVSSCSNYDPTFYSPFDLARVKAKPGAIMEHGACRFFAWKNDPNTGEILLGSGGEWKPFNETLGYELVGAEIKPFDKDEKLAVRFGSLSRMRNVVFGQADIRTLEVGDAIFAGDGTFRAKEIALSNRPLHLPQELSGRYYVDGHIIVLELDSGPILVGFGGKIETDGKITGLFLGGSAYGVYGQ
jgi:hypothetical protein